MCVGGCEHVCVCVCVCMCVCMQMCKQKNGLLCYGAKLQLRWPLLYDVTWPNKELDKGKQNGGLGWGHRPQRNQHGRMKLEEDKGETSMATLCQTKLGSNS